MTAPGSTTGPGLTGDKHRLVVHASTVGRTAEQVAAQKELARLQQEDRHEAQKRAAAEREAERRLTRETIEQAKKAAIMSDGALKGAIGTHATLTATLDAEALSYDAARSMRDQVSRDLDEAIKRVEDLRALLNIETSYVENRSIAWNKAILAKHDALEAVRTTTLANESAWSAVNGAFRKAHRDRALRRRAHEILGTKPGADS
jgi:hypothetical protein